MKKIGGEVLAKLKSIGNVEFLDDRSVNPVSRSASFCTVSGVFCF